VQRTALRAAAEPERSARKEAMPEDRTIHPSALMKNGLSANPQSSIHLLHPGKRRGNETLICKSEIGNSKGDRGGFQDLVEDHLDYLLASGPLCIFKEFPCGHGGSIDFLAFNGDGLVFLVEVKRARDQRAKFDVVFQVLKYHCFPAEILQKLKEPFLESKLKAAFGLSQDKAASVAERARTNIEQRLMNPVIVVDEASYPLIAHAYSLALRDIEGELRVIEVNVQLIHAADQATAYDLVYVRRFFSNDKWIGNACRNNRKPTEYTSLEQTLRFIPDASIQQMVFRLLNETGVRVAQVAKREKSFTLISHKAYFSFDPEGKISQGMYPRTAKPENPYRVVLVETEPDDAQRLIEAGFREVVSHNGKQTYHVFDLMSTTTDKEIARLVAVLRALRTEPKAG
jgi:hypothetical protein